MNFQVVNTITNEVVCTYRSRVKAQIKCTQLNQEEGARVYGLREVRF